jgi:hypothetical protein
MKTNVFLPILIILAFFGCKKDSNTDDSLPFVNGLSLYWDHEVFGDEGRVLRFEFYETKEYGNIYELKFEYSIDHQDILIKLTDKIDKGKCPRFPTAGGIDTLCTPKGLISIPEKLLPKGTYTITLKSSNFEVKSELEVGNEKITLVIPSNEFFASYIKVVYPIPQNLVFGSVVYLGSENTESANYFINDLTTLGLQKTQIPNYPYRHLSVDDNGNTENSHWPADNHSLGFIYKMDNNFKAIFNLAKEHFNKANINIYLFSSEGDEARLSKTDGIDVRYSNP